MKPNVCILFSLIFLEVFGVLPTHAESETAPHWSAAMVKVSSEEEIENLKSEGTEILRRRGDILLCLMPDPEDNVRERYGASRRSHSTRPPRFDSKITPALDKATEFFNASYIQKGNGFEKPYSGKGVVVGICDIGFDPLHPTFLDSDGNSRVKRVTQYIEHENRRILLEGNDQYAEWGTDDADNYHATHVCGILAGGGAESPYAGIATDAEIVVSTSTLTDVGLLAGVEDIIDYAKEVGKPCVINLSMGNYVGAHDGTSLFSQYLDMCADDAIIVLSAGNEGNETNCIHYDFTSSSRPLQFRLGSRDWSQCRLDGMTDIWSGDDTPLSVGISIYDDQTKQFVYEYEPVSMTDYDSVTYNWSGYDDPEVKSADEWSLDGCLTVYGGVDPENGRYQAAVVYEYDSSVMVEGKPWARYLVCVSVYGREGKDVDVYSDANHTRLMGMQGSPAPDSSMSFSDLACGHRVVSVGMYGNRAEAPYTDPMSGDVVMEPTGYKPGEIAIHSSYATLRDGRVMPLTVAPGATLMSAFSRPYHDAHPDKDCMLLDAPWIALGGTSMSSPYVAGYIATFLEADPALTAEDILYLISETNVSDVPDPSNPRHGAGWFDPVSIMRRIVSEGGVSRPSDPTSLLAPDDHVTLMTIDGKVLYSGLYSTLPAVSSGIHILHTPYGAVKLSIL